MVQRKRVVLLVALVGITAAAPALAARENKAPAKRQRRVRFDWKTKSIQIQTRNRLIAIGWRPEANGYEIDKHTLAIGLRSATAWGKDHGAKALSFGYAHARGNKEAKALAVARALAYSNKDARSFALGPAEAGGIMLDLAEKTQFGDATARSLFGPATAKSKQRSKADAISVFGYATAWAEWGWARAGTYAPFFEPEIIHSYGTTDFLFQPIGLSSVYAGPITPPGPNDLH